MDDRAAFLRAISDQPADRTARLVFADFLEESGAPNDAVRAEFIRAQVEAETVHPNSNRAAELDHRARELFAAHWLEWWEPVCRAVGLPAPRRPVSGVRGWFARLTTPPAPIGSPYSRGWGFGIDIAGGRDGLPDSLRTISFSGGFPDSLAFLGHLGTAAECLRPWPDAAPLARLELNGIVARDWRLIDGPHLRGLHTLQLKHATGTVIDSIGRSWHLPQLEELHLVPDRSNLVWGEQQYWALARSSLATRLKRLIVDIGTLSESQALLGAPFEHLSALEIREPRPRAEWMRAAHVADGTAQLMASVHLTELAELTLDAGTSAAVYSSHWPLLPCLRRLELVPPNALALQACLFPSERLFPALTDLAVTVLTPDWIDALADWPAAKRLRHLCLVGRLREKEFATGALFRLASALDAEVIETVFIGRGLCSSPLLRDALAERFGARVRFG